MPFQSLFRPAFVRRAAQVLAILILLGGVLAQVPPAQAAPLRAAIGVSTVADEYGSGAGCSLREAIQAANTDTAFGGCPAGFGADVINLPAGTYTLSLPGNAEQNNTTGDLDILSDLTISGAGAATTIIQGGAGWDDKIIDINPNVDSVLNVTITGVTVQNGNNTSAADIWGGGIQAFGRVLGVYTATGTLTLQNCTVTNNTYAGPFSNEGGGGLLAEQINLNVDNCTFSSNSTTNENGGGVSIIGMNETVSITDSTFTGNSAPGYVGGAIFIRRTSSVGYPSVAGSITLDHNSFETNSSTYGGAIYLWVQSGGNPVTLSVNVHNSLFVGNTATTSGRGLYYSGEATVPTVNFENNWWGCSTAPSAAPCDTAVVVGAGLLDTNPWLRNELTASPSPLVVNQSTALMASFLTNSDGVAVPFLSYLDGRSVNWGATLGTLSGTQATVQAGGTATGNFQATGAGTAVIYAQVDNDNTTPVSSNVLSLTVNKANTTTAIPSDLPDPSLVGQAVTVTYTVTGAQGNSPTAPTGNVTVTDGVNNCTGTVAAGSCAITLATPGLRSLTATYAGDANFNGSTSSPGVAHTVNQAPSITSANNTTFTVGSAGTFTLTTTGYPTGASMVIGEVGALPSGVTFTNNGDGTATLAGTPAAGTGGTYPITISASNGILPDASQAFTLTVDEAPSITGANTTTFTATVAGTFTVTTSGYPTGTSMAISEVGALPSGVTFTDNNDGTATLAGTPASGTQGNYPLTITAANGVLPDATQSFTLVVQPDLRITSADNTTFVVGTPGSFTVTTAGVPIPSLSESGALPSGVTFTDNLDGTGTLSGTPAAGTQGSYPITFTAINGVSPNYVQNFTLTVALAPTITSANNVTFTAGSAGSFTVTTTGFPAPAIARGGAALPSGVNFVDNGNGTGTLSGTPAAGTGGTYPITITAANGILPDATQNFTLTVNEAPAITSADNTAFAVGSAGSFTVTTTGYPTGASMSITEIGALPSGVTFVNNGDGTATLAGTPAAGTQGSYPITITAGNGVSPNATQNFTLTVNLAPTITSAASTIFTIGSAGSFTVTTTGFPYPAISIPPGSLPTGVTFTDNGNGTATLAGTPAAGTNGTYPFTITAANGILPDAIQNFTLTVSLAATTTTITSDAPDPSAVGQTVTVTFTVTSAAPGTPSGTVTVTDGVDSCSADAVVGTCSLALTTVGAHNLTASYAGNSTFAGSVSAGEPHTVNQANTTTAITADAPDPSLVGEPVTVNYSVTAVPPGTGTPTGNVTVTDGVDSCTGTVAAGSCMIAFTSAGSKTLTATYAGDTNFGGSTSAGVAHSVTMAGTTIAITSDLPDPSIAGVPLPVAFSVTVFAPGGGTPTGTVTITDGVDNCTAAVAAGTCNLTLTTVGGRFLTASYSGDANYGGSTSVPEPHIVQGPPAVTLVNSVADTGDGQVAENEHTAVAITQLLVVFNKDMNALDAATVGNYHLVLDGSPVDLVNSVAYNNVTFTTTLNINGGVALPPGDYTLTVSGILRDTLGAPIGADFIRHFAIDTSGPAILSSGVVGQPGGVVITNGGAYSSHFTSFTLSFDEDVANAGGGAGVDDVANPLNYLLLRPGTNAAYDTISCQVFAANGNLPLGDDVRVPTGPVTYTNNGGAGPFVATVTVNGGASLPDGDYRLLVCGTTSIVDLAGNPLNGGLDSAFTFRIFTAAAAPATGFAPGRLTLLPEQPASLAYADLGSLWIEIPALGVRSTIVGVPVAGQTWDVTWLYNQVGWLEGTAYPTWEGNSILTAHAYTADGLPGPFAALRSLVYDDTIVVHMGGMRYTYAVRTNGLVRANNVSYLIRHEESPWLTLVTCQQYDEQTGTYRYRRVVRAVLVSVTPGR